ncbi:hypothetical protein [Cypionkella sp. TWP1-2-1b2]|uniref:phage tail tape measure protein n=1 Tax=Cypionkella sp. TWP1-2-1b2 TaxID=2804675 RepID=UPI003CE90A65
MTDLIAAMELRVKNDQAKAALAATKGDLKAVGTAAAEASVQGAKLGPAIGAGARVATPQVQVLKRELTEVHSGSMLAGNGARLFSQQLSQVGQQTMATGQFVQALAIQLPDIGIAFGAVGGAVGLLAGIALPLLMSALGGTDDKAKIADETLKTLTESLKTLRAVGNDLGGSGVSNQIEQYGKMATAAREVLEVQQKIAEARAQMALLSSQHAIAGLFGDFKDALTLGDNAVDATNKLYALGNIAAALGIDFQEVTPEIEAVAAALSAVEAAKGPQESADAMARLRDAILAATDNGKGLNEEAIQVLQNLTDAELAALELAGVNIAGTIGAGADEAGRLAGNLDAAARSAAQIAAAKYIASNQVGGGGYMANQYAQYGLGHTAMDAATKASDDLYWNPSMHITPKSAGGAGGRGGAGKIDPDSFNALTDAAEKALATLEAKIAAIHEKVNLGLMSMAEGTKAIASAKDQAANSIAELIPKLEKVADAAGPKAANAVAKWRAEVKGLVGDLSEASAALADKLSSNFEKGFADFLSGAKRGKDAMADFKNFVIQQLAAIAAQKFTASIITPFIDSLVGSITGGLSGGTGVTTNAVGGVYSGPGISAYSGTVVHHPTFFPFAKGVGLMGEAGAEAILPLSRGADGKLGVHASGGGSVVVNITTPAGTKASSSERSDGNSRIIDVMIETVEGAIAGHIAQGRGPVPEALANTYGLSRLGS